MNREVRQRLLRRSTLKTLAASGLVAGGTVNRGWIQPVVQGVVLPAHAQTSPDSNGGRKLAGIEDPCILVVTCRDDVVEVEANGQVEGSGDLSGIHVRVRLDVEGSDGGAEAPQIRDTQTASDGSWGPLTFETTVREGTATATASARDFEFDTIDCTAAINCTSGPGNGGDPCNKCDNPTLVRIKYDADGGGWDAGTGNNDCLKSVSNNQDGSAFATVSDIKLDEDNEPRRITVELTRSDCWIQAAQHKEGQNCERASIAGNCQSATFTKVDRAISHVELIIACCGE